MGENYLKVLTSATQEITNALKKHPDYPNTLPSEQEISFFNSLNKQKKTRKNIFKKRYLVIIYIKK